MAAVASTGAPLHGASGYLRRHVDGDYPIGQAGADTSAALSRLEQCAADAELLALARECLASHAKDRPADAGAVALRMTAYLEGVQERLRQAELSRAAESAVQEAQAKADAERRRGN